MTYDIRLKTFFRLLICAPSGSGKTTLVKNLLKECDRLFDIPPAKVIYHYNLYQDLFDEMKNDGLVHEFRHGAPSMESVQELAVYKDEGGCLLIIDDLLQSVGADMAELFQVGSRHNGVSIIFLSQNLFPKNKHFRDISLNCSYICLPKNVRDKSSIVHFFLFKRNCKEPFAGCDLL